MQNNELVIGLFGFGVVGEGLYHVLEKSKTINARIHRICVKHPNKKRSLPETFFTNQAAALFDDPEINLFVELIDDAQAAFLIAEHVLKAGKSIVSGNKKMLATHLPELIQLQETHGGTLLYEASACGSIPIIRNLEEYYDNDLMTSVTGILNGSSNYILSRLSAGETDYSTALNAAQQAGFAESDPSADVNGTDAMHKLIIIATHAIGNAPAPEEVFHAGISKIQPHELRFAAEKGCKIKLVAKLQKQSPDRFSMYVMPAFVPVKNYIYNVEDEYNGVVIEGQFYDKQFMFGKGAGALPTGSAVLSDITARAHQYRYEYKKKRYFKPLTYSNDYAVKIYLRFENLIDLSRFNFETVSERFSSSTYQYVVGTIKLSALIELQPMLPKMDVFIAVFEV
jgi:homoserine dehydrogenase